jgi:nucleotide-binding universal stress UspA family protein
MNTSLQQTAPSSAAPKEAIPATSIRSRDDVLADRPRVEPIKIETLLVPIDFSAASMEMLDYAAALAKQFHANVHLVHIYPPDEAALVPGAGHLMRQTAEELFSDQLLPAHREEVPSFWPQNCHVRSGSAYQEICELARDIHADVIVLATRGHTGLKHVLLGSTAERVVRMAPCPVLVLRQKKQKSRAVSRPTKGRPVEFNVRKILVPVDFSQCSLAGAMHAALFAKTLDATVCFIHVVYPPGPVLVDRVTGENSRRNELERADARLNMEAFMKLDFLRGIKCESEIRTGHPIDEICSESSRPDIDLIISSTHGRTGLDHMLLGSVAEHVVRYAECPVMVVPSRCSRF